MPFERHLRHALRGARDIRTPLTAPQEDAGGHRSAR
jgi:hypothetical protein